MNILFNVGNALKEWVIGNATALLPKVIIKGGVKIYLNNTILKPYGNMTKLEINKEKTTIDIELDLKGEDKPIHLKLVNYELSQEGPISRFNPGTPSASREWLSALLAANAKPFTITDPTVQAIMKSLL